VIRHLMIVFPDYVSRLSRRTCEIVKRRCMVNAHFGVLVAFKANRAYLIKQLLKIKRLRL